MVLLEQLERIVTQGSRGYRNPLRVRRHLILQAVVVDDLEGPDVACCLGTRPAAVNVVMSTCGRFAPAILRRAPIFSALAWMPPA